MYQSEEYLNVSIGRVFKCINVVLLLLLLFLGGVNGRSDYLWQINFSSMEKSKKSFIIVSDMKC